MPIQVLDQETRKSSARGQKSANLASTQQNLKLTKVSSSGESVRTDSGKAAKMPQQLSSGRQPKPQIASKTQVIDMKEHRFDPDYFSQETQIERLQA